MTATENTLTGLSEPFAGLVITPDHPDYDTARAVASGVDRRPHVLLRPHDATGVAEVVRHASATGLPLAVRSGGHSGAGFGVVDDGIVLDLGGLRQVEVDVTAGTAWVGAGLTAGEATTALAEHGVATGFGDTGSVGVGGITLGGGLGFLSRRYGMTIDNLLAAEVVTAEGELLRVDDQHHAELFWALRGGGGNFGVVTRFLFRVHELREVYGGMLILPASAEVLSGLVTLAAEAPRELSTIVNVMPAPPMPFLPEEAHGSMIAMALVCFAGPEDEGRRALEPLRALATPVADLVGQVPYPAMFPPEDHGAHPQAAARSVFVDGLDRPAAQAVLDRLADGPYPMRVAQFRVLGGAVADVAPDATAYAHRGEAVTAFFATFFETPEQKVAADTWVTGMSDTLASGEDRVYVNFLGAEDAQSRVRAAYPGATWDRLVAVKRRYDPGNLFRLNSNIAP